jgi:hypothetical protein
MDDDYFFLRPVSPSDFFDEQGRSVQRGALEPLPGEDSRLMRRIMHCQNGDTGDVFLTGTYLAGKAIAALFNQTLLPFFPHIPIPAHVSVIREMNQRIDVQGNISAEIRTCGDFQFQSLYLGYSYYAGHSVVRLGEWGLSWGPFSWTEDLLNKAPKLACVNSIGKSAPLFLRKFPTPSSFELAGWRLNISGS